jgi:ABC-2 type transport system ATP-binding protein
VLVRVRGDADAAMAAVSGALSLPAAPYEGQAGAFLVSMAKGTDRRDEIARAVVGGGFGLLELKGLELSLEDVFRQLTTDEARAA